MRGEPRVDELLTASLRDARSVLAIDASRLAAGLTAASVHELSAPDEEVLAARAGEGWDAAIVGGLGPLDALALSRALLPCIRAGGTIVLALPTARDRSAGATRSILGLLRRKLTLAFEDLCEALLLAGLEDVEAREGGSGASLVWGRVRDPGAAPDQ